jgi:hypothetical protein
LRREGLKVGIETNGPGIGVHIKAIFFQTGDVRAIELAAKGHHETVILKPCQPPGASRLDLDMLIGEVDAGHLPFHSLDAHRSQDIIQGNPDRTQISFVVAHSDAMIRVRID